MKENQEYIKFLKSTRTLFSKYNLKQINLNIYTINDGNGNEKTLLEVKIKDNNNLTLEDGYYDILLGGSYE